MLALNLLLFMAKYGWRVLPHSCDDGSSLDLDFYLSKYSLTPWNRVRKNRSENRKKRKKRAEWKKWVSTGSSQVAASLDLFARSRRSTHHNTVHIVHTRVCTRQVFERSMIFITIVGGAFFGRISGVVTLAEAQLQELGLGCSEFSGVTSCPGLLVAPGSEGGGGGETGHHGDTWGHKNFQGLQKSLSVISEIVGDVYTE